MKKLLLALFSITIPMFATFAQESNQEKSVNEVVNTLKERIKLAGYFQSAYSYDDAAEVTNTFETRRVVLIASGKITDKWAFKFLCTLYHPKLLEAYTIYKVLDNNSLNLQLGQFKTPLTIENQLSPSAVELIDVYSLATRYLAGINGMDPMYGANSGRDIGFLVSGNVLKNYFNYKVGVYNGQGKNEKDVNNEKDVYAALNFYPVKNLTLNVSGMIGRGNAKQNCAVNWNNTNIPIISAGSNYDKNRITAGFMYKSKKYSLRSEFITGKDDIIRSTGYYAIGSYELLKNFDLIASYDCFDEYTDDNEHQTNYIGGIQYWFYPRCRLQLQYTYRNFKKADDSNIVQLQAQVRF